MTPTTDQPEPAGSTATAGSAELGERARRSREGMSKPVEKVLLRGLGLVLLAVALVFGLLRLGVLPGQRTSVSAATIQSSFTDVAELATQDYSFTDVGKYSEDNKEVLGVEVPMTGSSFLVTYSGTVKAGIKDASAVTVDVDDASRTVTVTAPAVQVLSTSIDPDTVTTYDQSLNPLNQTEVSDVTGFLSDQEKSEEDKAVKGGLLTKAQDRAESLLTEQVKATLKGTEQEDYAVKVTFKDAAGK
ncbi:DUF4230 domain-containing protein [Actinomyces haliotis]|uniref:DUF4230 domain-containing protein n=1 Tax=Actinomyces haliotis TaxID=1280843 RepID=UPI001E549D19|nr:DUF4230 domain-containing protein [Actinomyces haliotis]